ncbi:TIR domain-containing protein (plasmid) [Rhizobium leguminosarum]
MEMAIRDALDGSAFLRIQVLFHWESQRARDLAKMIYRTFSARPSGDGPRIPVRYGLRQVDGGPPPALELNREHEIIVILIDGRMARRARKSDVGIADRWAQLTSDLLRDHGPASISPHRILPVAVDAEALGLAPSLDNTSFVRLDVREGADRDRHLILHIAVRALRVLRDLPRAAGGELDRLPDIPVSLFISHAKRDLPSGPTTMAQGPVKSILAALSQLPVSGWYDSAQIPPGGQFPDEIRNGVLTSSVLVTILTDSWSSREWCRRELLEAKLARRPLIVVDALEQRVVRLFPYLGNSLTLRWRAAIAVLAEGDSDADWPERRSRWEEEDAALVIEAALLEALRHQYEDRRLLAMARENDLVISTPPEALTLAHLPDGTRRVLYPDPPLGHEELERLQMGAGKEHVDLTTPLGELARWQRPAHVQIIALSLSNATDAENYGGGPEHLATVADDLVLYLMIAGLRVAYGGVLGHGALKDGRIEGDDINYIERLFAMVRSHSVLLNDVAARQPAPIENFVAWPLHCEFGDEQLRQYGQLAVLNDLGPPPDLDIDQRELRPLADGFFPPDDPVRRYAWARSLTFMRETVRDKASARVIMGGKLTDYLGLWPGVLEEAVLSLRARQPLYVLGLFGGAARLFIDVLRGVDRGEMTSEWFAQYPTLVGLRGEFSARGHVVQAPEELAKEIRSYAPGGLSSALNNGLNDQENLELSISDDPRTITALILEGLRRTAVV